jgi:hypothetical protein
MERKRDRKREETWRERCRQIEGGSERERMGHTHIHTHTHTQQMERQTDGQTEDGRMSG